VAGVELFGVSRIAEMCLWSSSRVQRTMYSHGIDSRLVNGTCEKVQPLQRRRLGTETKAI
jgi:hypothetical protein